MSERKIDIAVIGAMKSASTTVTDYLRQHPEVFVPDRKLLNYFSYGMIGETLSEQDGRESTAGRMAIRTEAEYWKQFEQAPYDQLLADCSDSYYFYPGTAERLFAHNPEMKIIIAMRDPVSRAYSSFNHARSHMLERESNFEDVLARTLETEEQLLPIRRYRALGMYGALLRPYVESFGPKQIHLLGFEELAEDYNATMRRLTDFLDVAPYEGDRLWSNPTFVPPSGLIGRTIVALEKPLRWLLRFGSGRNALKERIKKVVKLVFSRPERLSHEIQSKHSHLFADDVATLDEMFGPGFYSKWK